MYSIQFTDLGGSKENTVHRVSENRQDNGSVDSKLPGWGKAGMRKERLKQLRGGDSLRHSIGSIFTVVTGGVEIYPKVFNLV